MNPFSWKNRNRDLTLILATFLLGLVFMLVSGTLAISLTPQWTVKANMDSMLDPDEDYAEFKGTQAIEPISPAILTPATWQFVFLTPQSTPTPTRSGPGNVEATATSKSQNTPAATARMTNTAVIQKTKTATAQVTPSKTFIIIFPSATFTTKVPTAKPTNTVTITRTPSKTPTATKTATGTKTATSTKTATPTVTLTPTVTQTPTVTATSTVTETPTVTATWTSSMTPTVTQTPTQTATPTITITPTPILIDWGPPDGDWQTPNDGDSLTFMISPPITDHGDAGYDFVYYERATGPTSIQLDNVLIEISQDNSTWYPVFNWGDNIPDTNSNVDFILRGFGGESDNQNVSGGLINNTGIGIDIFSLGLTGSYSYLRITCTGSGGDGCDIDAIEIYP